MEGCTAKVDAECFKLIQGNYVPSQFSKPYLMYSATDTASVTVDYAKGNIEDSVMNSPPSHGAGRLPVCSSSPLRGCNWTPTGQRSCLLTEKTVCTSQRQLYSKPPKCSIEDAKEIDLVHFDKEIQVQSATKLLKSLSYGSSRHWLPEERDRLLRTQSLIRQPSLQLLTKGCVSSGRNAYSVHHQSYPELSLFMLIRQSRERDCASARVSCPKAYLRQDKIPKGIAMLKSEKMDGVGVNFPWWHMMAYGLKKLWTSYIRVAKNNISLCYNPYTNFKMNGVCTYCAQPLNIITLYRQFLSWSLKSLVWVLFILVLYYPIWSKFAIHKCSNSHNNRDYSLKFINLSQFNEYGLVANTSVGNEHIEWLMAIRSKLKIIRHIWNEVE